MNFSSDWQGYTNACWAANWHRLFAGDPSDARGKMGWPGRFADALTNATEVSSYSWQKQETHRGLKDIAGTAEGGWGFNMLAYDPPACYSAAEAAAMVADGSITDTPVFNCEFVPMLLDNASVDDQWYALAKCVPAVSSAVGGCPITFGNKISNHDLNGGERYRNGWGRPSEDDATPWKHSDMKDMAYFYVYKLYEQLVENGGLK